MFQEVVGATRSRIERAQGLRRDKEITKSCGLITSGQSTSSGTKPAEHKCSVKNREHSLRRDGLTVLKIRQGKQGNTNNRDGKRKTRTARRTARRRGRLTTPAPPPNINALHASAEHRGAGSGEYPETPPGCGATATRLRPEVREGQHRERQDRARRDEYGADRRDEGRARAHTCSSTKRRRKEQTMNSNAIQVEQIENRSSARTSSESPTE